MTSGGSNRRGFLGKAAALGLAGASLGARPAAAKAIQPSELKLGLASYSTRAFSLEETLAMTNALGLKYITLKAFHLPLEASQQECKAAAKKVKGEGITLMGGGVIRLPHDKDAVRSAFDYAAAAGMPTIVAAPDPSILPFVNEMVKKYGIQVAIHSHGPRDPHFPSPVDAYEQVKSLDKRLGVCMDTGHTVLNGEDEVAAIHTVKDRLLDFHLKDVDRRDKKGNTTEFGRGVVRLAEVIHTLAQIGYQGHVAIEYEKDKDAPMPGLSECVGYFRGAVSALELG